MTHDPNLNADSPLSQPADWDTVWQQHFDAYQDDRRHAYYIAAVRRQRERRILEIAAGSFRDMGALNEWGIYCEGVDYSSESVQRAKEKLPVLSERIKKMDAKRLDYPNRSFDLTFHNGFWGLFDDAKIAELAAEQARVSTSRMVATVHNAHNRSFREQFAVWSRRDPLYKVRFFFSDEIENLMKPFCRRVTVLPVGGGRVDWLISRGLGPMAYRCIYRLRGCFRQNIEDGQRLMCIGEM